jgi:hypothetical protein
MDIRVQVWLGCQKEFVMKYLLDPLIGHVFLMTHSYYKFFLFHKCIHY